MNTEADAPKFVTGDLMRHVVVMSVTGSIGLMAIFFVDFVDMIFISMLGNAALAAAVGYAGTILFFTTSIGIGLSIAAGALVARSLGGGRRDEAREYATSVLLLAVVVGIGTFAGVLAALPAILDFLGATGEARDLAVLYLAIILPTTPILAAALVGSAVLRAYGDARRAMLATLAGGVVNAVLDPVLIFGVGLELKGAAIASVLARLTIFVAALWPAIRIYRGFAWPRPGLIARDARPVFAIAGPAMLTNVATPIGSAIVTREVAQFGTDAVAGMAIIARLTPVAFAVVFALSGAIGPIIGQNAGAGLPARVGSAFRAGLVFVTVYVLVVAVLLFVLRGAIADIFNAQGVARSLLFLFCGPLALGFVFNGAIFVCNATFNNLGRPIYSTAVNWGRHTLGTWPLAVAGGAIGGAGGVLIGQALGGVIFAGLAVLLARRVIAAAEVPSTTEPFHERAHVVATRRH